MKKPLSKRHAGLMRVRPAEFVMKCLVLALMYAVGIAGVALHEGLAAFPYQLLIGLGLAHQTEVIHELLHQLGTGRPRLDRIAGRLFGMPVGVSFWLYRAMHLWHHAHVGREDDAESFGYTYSLMTSRSRLKRIAGLLLHFSMISHFTESLRRAGLATIGQLDGHIAKNMPQVKEADRSRIRVDYLLIVVWVVGLGAVSVLVRSPILLEYWLIPMMVWAPVHAIIELPEHFGCDHPDEDVLQNTRSIRAGRLMVWFTNGNCFHVGHHENMKVPIGRLRTFESNIRTEGTIKYDELSYLDFFRQFAAHIWHGHGFRYAAWEVA